MQGQGSGATGDYQKYMSDYQQYMQGHGGGQGSVPGEYAYVQLAADKADEVLANASREVNHEVVAFHSL